MCVKENKQIVRARMFHRSRAIVVYAREFPICLFENDINAKYLKPFDLYNSLADIFFGTKLSE